MLKKTQKIFLLIVLVCCLAFLLLQLKAKRSRALHKSVQMSSVEILGWDYEPQENVEARLTKDAVKYVLMVPHKLQSTLKSRGVTSLAEEDREALLKLTEFLDEHAEYDAATGTTTEMQVEGFDKAKKLLEQSACRFLVKNWTMIIRNFGSISYDDDSESLGWYQECNIAETAFVLRKEAFMSLRWRAECGSMSHLDFFVRSNGALKIAKLSNCFLTHALAYSDRGMLEGSRDFIDYSTLGQIHSILRIVRPDKIEWTKCAYNKEFCPENPSTPRLNTLAAADGFPICCAVIMDDMLTATVDAMNQVGIEYRIAYATALLLGAVRSQTSIPYTEDVDVVIRKADNDRYASFWLMQQILGPRYFVAWKTNPPVSRVYPHFAPTVAVDTLRHFKGDNSLESDALFDSKILKEMEKLLPVKPIEPQQCLVDMYPSPEEWFGKSTQVTINNRQYPGVSDNVDAFLRRFYGDDYMEMRPEIHSNGDSTVH
ncbi:hypothetical protein OS493_025462 [Desmophyllum pertusum]|uniref:Uncharacterized protein n=1 Tax=Desmophyllum pertusum TaxID=174260 RepID=A0A9W9YL80_9CNID|nr:hypothetical protein OS493_025462 [Desmophyllum pertusum]